MEEREKRKEAERESATMATVSILSLFCAAMSFRFCTYRGAPLLKYVLCPQHDSSLPYALMYSMTAIFVLTVFAFALNIAKLTPIVLHQTAKKTLWMLAAITNVLFLCCHFEEGNVTVNVLWNEVLPRILGVQLLGFAQIFLLSYGIGLDIKFHTSEVFEGTTWEWPPRVTKGVRFLCILCCMFGPFFILRYVTDLACPLVL